MVGIIVVIWVIIALPNFLRFAARAKQSEAKQDLGALYTTYQAYHNEYHTYPSSPLIQKGDTLYNCFTITHWKPKEQWPRYNFNCMGTEVFSPPLNDYPCPPGITTTATKDSFTVAACGNVDNDATVDVWTIDDRKKLKNVVDDVRK